MSIGGISGGTGPLKDKGVSQRMADVLPNFKDISRARERQRKQTTWDMVAPSLHVCIALVRGSKLVHLPCDLTNP